MTLARCGGIALLLWVSVFATWERAFGDVSYVIPRAVTYVAADGSQQIRVFTFSADGHLVADAWDGTAWTWFDLGVPPQGVQYGDTGDDITAIAYVDEVGAQQVRVFFIGTDRHLYTDAWDGMGWTWFDLGTPLGVNPVQSPTAIEYADGGVAQIRVFIPGDNGHLLADAWDGESWTWSDLGAPPGAFFSGDLTPITYVDGGIQQIHVFVGGSLNLYDSRWDGRGWTWFDLGRPPGGQILFGPNAITYLDERGVRQIRVFGSAGTKLGQNDLVAIAWDGASWTWDVLEQGGGEYSYGFFQPSAVTYVDGFGARQIQVFSQLLSFGGQFDPSLAVDSWNGVGWTLDGLGSSDVRSPGPPNAITYVDAGSVQQIRVFFVGGSPFYLHLNAFAWDGTSWSWFDLWTL